METSNKVQISANALAALLAHRVSLQYQRKCCACRRVAMRGRRTCVFHSFRKLADLPGRVEQRKLRTLGRLGLLPVPLDLEREYRAIAPLTLHLALLWHDQARQALAFAEAWRSWRSAIDAASA